MIDKATVQFLRQLLIVGKLPPEPKPEPEGWQAPPVRPDFTGWRDPHFVDPCGAYERQRLWTSDRGINWPLDNRRFGPNAATSSARGSGGGS